MKVIEALQIPGRGVVVIADVRLSDIAVTEIGLRPGMPVFFVTPAGRRIDSNLRSLELFSSPFNPNKPFAFVIEDGPTKADIHPGSEIVFPGAAA
jgi:hypothetical protein